MTSDPTTAATSSTQRPFPTLGESIKFGWDTLRDNIGLVLVWSVAFGFFSAISDIVTPDTDSDARVFWIAVAILASGLVANLFQVVAIRRTLDYWDERHGLAQPKNFSTAFSSSMHEAAPRLLPSIGWSFLPILGLAAMAAVTFFALVAIDVAWVTAIVIIAEIVLVFYLAVIWGFYNQAVIDRPGNPFPRSAQVAKGRFWHVLGAFIVFGLIIFFASIPVGVVIALIDPTVMTDPSTQSASAPSDMTSFITDAIYSTVASIIAFGFVNGAMSNMYRAVFPTSDS